MERIEKFPRTLNEFESCADEILNHIIEYYNLVAHDRYGKIRITKAYVSLPF